MGQVILFPENKLNVKLCSHYNGHNGVVTQNTDRLKDGQYELGELSCFKHNIQATSFLNPYAVINGENAEYDKTLKEIDATGRISFGIYYRTDSWINPITGVQQIIPSYNSPTWGQSAIDAGFNVTLGQSKPTRYPNHGQQLFDESDGKYGYDFVNNIIGLNNLAESNNHSVAQINYFKNILGRRLSCFSYENGRAQGAKTYIPYFLGGRNSATFNSGNSFVDYGVNAPLTRMQNITRASNTRIWDNIRANNFPSQQDAFSYMNSQINRAVSNKGFFTDFMHWHSLYDFNDVGFFDPFFSEINNAIGSNDVWRAGYSEAIEYMYLRNSIDMLGSFEHQNKVYIAFRSSDLFADTETNSIDNDVSVDMLQTPISIEVDLSSTSLQGQNITSAEASSIRSKGGNKWVINARQSPNSYGYTVVSLSSGAQEYYNESLPVITFQNNTISVNIASKIVVWRKLKTQGIENITEFVRENSYRTSFSFSVSSDYDYYVGAITKFNKSSLIEF